MKVRMGGGQTREGTKGDDEVREQGRRGGVNVKQGDKEERFIDTDRG